MKRFLSSILITLALALPAMAATTVTFTTNNVSRTVVTPVVTRTTVETVDAATVNVTPATTTTTVTTSADSPQKSLFYNLQNLLSLHDPSKNYFNGSTNDWSSSVQLNQSAVTDSRKSGLYQSTQIGFWHRLDPSLELGIVGEADSLGSGGNTVDEIGGHLMLRYDWDNVAAEVGIGGLRDVSAQTGILEVLFGFEVRISHNVGTFAAVGFDYDPQTRGKNGIGDRLMAGITVAFGK